MRFKTFLESQDKISLDGYKESLDAIIDRKIFLFRGEFAGSHADIKMVTLKDEAVKIITVARRFEPRGSLTSDDMLLNIAKKWKDVPDRSHSYFCTRDFDHAEGFSGRPYLIIPSDRVKLYAVTNQDFNEFSKRLPIKDGIFEIIKSAKRLFREIAGVVGANVDSDDEAGKTLIAQLSELIADAGIKAEIMQFHIDTKGLRGEIQTDKIDKYSKLVASVMKNQKEITDLIDKANDDHWDTTNLKYEIEWLDGELSTRGYESLDDVFNHITPKNFGVKTYTSLSTIPPEAHESDEIWFEGGYMAINFRDADMKNASFMIDVLQELRKQFS